MPDPLHSVEELYYQLSHLADGSYAIGSILYHGHVTQARHTAALVKPMMQPQSVAELESALDSLNPDELRRAAADVAKLMNPIADTEGNQVEQTASYLYDLGPGLAVTRGDVRAEVTGNEYAILQLLRTTGRAGVENAMSPTDKSAVWREKYSTDKREKIQTALRRLNQTLLDKALCFEIELSGDELIVKSRPMPASE